MRFPARRPGRPAPIKSRNPSSGPPPSSSIVFSSLPPNSSSKSIWAGSPLPCRPARPEHPPPLPPPDPVRSPEIPPRSAAPPESPPATPSPAPPVRAAPCTESSETAGSPLSPSAPACSATTTMRPQKSPPRSSPPPPSARPEHARARTPRAPALRQRRSAPARPPPSPASPRSTPPDRRKTGRTPRRPADARATRRSSPRRAPPRSPVSSKPRNSRTPQTLPLSLKLPRQQTTRPMQPRPHRSHRAPQHRRRFLVTAAFQVAQHHRFPIPRRQQRDRPPQRRRLLLALQLHPRRRAFRRGLLERRPSPLAPFSPVQKLPRHSAQKRAQPAALRVPLPRVMNQPHKHILRDLFRPPAIPAQMKHKPEHRPRMRAIHRQVRLAISAAKRRHQLAIRSVAALHFDDIAPKPRESSRNRAQPLLRCSTA